MEIQFNTEVGEIVRINYKTVQLFEKYNIDFCCGGGISLSEACKKSNADQNKLISEIEALIQINDPDSEYIERLGLDELCNYIVKRHHSYVNENIPFLQQKIQKLCDVHGDNHPGLFEIKKLLDEVFSNLTVHMKKEELILFPHINEIMRYQKEGNVNPDEHGMVEKTINELEHEHQAEGERFGRISKLTNNYTIPSDGCNTYEVTFRTLQEFEQDLHRHIHLENNVLFKKALNLEQNLTTIK